MTTRFNDRGHTTGNQNIYRACSIALRWPGRVPSGDELHAAFDVSRATAYRWRRAMLDARGQLTAREQAAA